MLFIKFGINHTINLSKTSKKISKIAKLQDKCFLLKTKIKMINKFNLTNLLKLTNRKKLQLAEECY